MLQDEMIIHNTECDNLLVMWLIFIEELACIFQCLGYCFPGLEEASEILTCAADLSYCSVCACMQARDPPSCHGHHSPILHLKARNHENTHIPPPEGLCGAELGPCK